jgi:hypothetical protein
VLDILFSIPLNSLAHYVLKERVNSGRVLGLKVHFGVFFGVCISIPRGKDAVPDISGFVLRTFVGGNWPAAAST